MRVRTLAITIAASFSLTALGCSSQTSAAPATATPETKPDPAKFGRLEVPYARTVPVAGETKLNLSLRNPYREVVTGVRIIFVVTTSPDPKGMEVTRLQQELDLTIPPGDVKTLEIIAPPQARARGAGTFLRVYAWKRGGETMPLPPEWRAKN